MADSLLDRLIKHTALPFHMPGHKRNMRLAPWLAPLGGDLDITEIPGFDDLHSPEDILKESMQMAAQLFKARHSFYLVNGSTGGILSAIRAMTRPLDTVLVARNCHKSVYNALSLCRLKPVFLWPPPLQDFPCFGALTTAQVEEAILQNPQASLLILTSPTYEGVIADLPGIISLAHAHGLKVLVDEAHGAHLDFIPFFSGSAVEAGADLVVQSLHKTLPSLTQTSIVHAQHDDDAVKLARQLAIFETTSPSYLFLASADSCIRYLDAAGLGPFWDWQENIEHFFCLTEGMTHLRRLGAGGVPVGAHGYDPSKLVFLTENCDIDGYDLAQRLQDEHDIVLEMAIKPYGLAMTGLGDTKESLGRFAEALMAIDRTLSPARKKRLGAPALRPIGCLDPYEAEERPYETLPVSQCAGRLAAEQLLVYPPGVPFLIPGELIDADMVSYIAQLMAEEANIHPARVLHEGTLRVIAG